jgi:hypothetical protein
VLQTAVLSAGLSLVRFHGTTFTANSFNPNAGKDWSKPDDGARFNPFPDLASKNVATLYAADGFAAAALESVFHAVAHVPSPDYSQTQLANWRYSELELKRDLTIFELTNPNLRQLSVPGRSNSLEEAELIHTQNDQYPNTRTWAHFLFHKYATLAGLAWRPRLAGQGTSYVLFGGRCESVDLAVLSGPMRIDSGLGFDRIRDVATAASIRIVRP